MKFFSLLALLATTTATTEKGIAMIQALDEMDGQNVENLSTVRAALVECSAAGDCTAEAAAMPSLALASNLPLRARFAACIRDNGHEFCIHKLEKEIDITEIELGGIKDKQYELH